MAESAEQQRLLRQAVSSLMQATLRKAFNTYRGSTTRAAWRDGAAGQSLRRIANRHLAAAYTQWALSLIHI